MLETSSFDIKLILSQAIMKFNLEPDGSFLEITNKLRGNHEDSKKDCGFNSSFDEDFDLGSFMTIESNDLRSNTDSFELKSNELKKIVQLDNDFVHKNETEFLFKNFEDDFMQNKKSANNSYDSMIEIINVSNLNTTRCADEEDSGSSIICNYVSPNIFELEDEIQLLRASGKIERSSDENLNEDFNSDENGISRYENNAVENNFLRYENIGNETIDNEISRYEKTRNEDSNSIENENEISRYENTDKNIATTTVQQISGKKDVLMYFLNEIFHLPAFRPMQRDIIEASLAKKDIFVLMPTGGGKSLTFQLPALVENGVTIVISPLLSLITDQISQLLGKDILALPINSTLNNADREMAFSALRGDIVKIFYVTPELIMQSTRFISILDELNRNKKLIRFVLDEAHCIQWGLDFRPDYLSLFSLKKKYNVPFTFLTATATESLIDMIQSRFGLKLNFFKSSFNRPNLNYKILRNVNKFKEILSLLLTFHELSGIIYCLTKKETEMLYSKLKGIVKCSFYHAGLNKNERSKIQSDWFDNKINVIISTIAFGMGIDKCDVRFVIHYTIPKSLENYYQETGRAGRDQLLSYCYLFYDYKDKIKVERLTKQSISEVVDFVHSKVCRRKYLLKYFNEKFDEKLCNKMCDNCCKSKICVDLLGQTIVNCILELSNLGENTRITRTTLIDILKGSKNRKSINYAELGSFNQLKSLKKEVLMEIIDALVVERFLREKVVKSNDFEWNELEVANKVVNNLFIEDTGTDMNIEPIKEVNTTSGFRKLSNTERCIKSSNKEIKESEIGYPDNKRNIYIRNLATKKRAEIDTKLKRNETGYNSALIRKKMSKK